MPTISLIAAMTWPDRVIGLNNTMPWHLPADLKHFKEITEGKPIIMGRKTFESIGRPLPKRRNLIISRQPHLNTPGSENFTSIDTAIDAASDAEEIMVIGGSELYRQTLSEANRLYLTLIDAQLTGDTYFPDWETTGTWQRIADSNYLADERNAYNLQFIVLERST